MCSRMVRFTVTPRRQNEGVALGLEMQDVSFDDELRSDEAVLADEWLDDEHVTWAERDVAQLVAQVSELEMTRRRLDVELAHVLYELERREACDREFGLRTGSYVSLETGMPLGAARSRVEFSQVLFERFPRVAQGFCEGLVPWSHVEVVCRAARNGRVADALSALDAELADQARVLPHRRWRRFVAELVDVLDVDGAEPAPLDRNELWVTPLFDGTYDITGVLVGELGASVHELLRSETERLRRQMRRDSEATDGELTVLGRSSIRALALRELMARGAVGVSGAPAADLTLVAHIRTGSGEDGPTDLPDLDRNVFRCLDGTRLRGSEIEDRLCDGLWRFLTVDDGGVPLQMGRSERFATDAQRAAARVRDGGCVFPGCDRPADETVQHHVDEFDRGGFTDLANLASLCRYHHGVTHRRGWTMVATDDHWYQWVTPAGRTIWSQRHGVPRCTHERAGPAVRSG